MLILAAVLAGLAAGLAAGVPRRAAGPAVAHGAGRSAGAVPVRRLVLLLGTAAATLAVVLDGTRLALGLVAAGATAGVLSLVARARSRAAADVRRGRVVEACEALAGELRAGLPAATALDRSADVWPELAPVVAAAGLGGDVPAALRRLAATPGAAGLRDVGAAWQVSQSSGSALAMALGQVAAGARARQATRGLVRAELASAQATARTVAALPLLTLAMAAGVGADPWHFLLATPAGLVCLAAGLALMLLGLHWIDRIAAAVFDP
ncbi:MAG: type II secretion system F family protein [Nocardioidaceae bacterium]